MGRPKRLYSLGKFRSHVPKDYDKNTAYPVVLEYTWNREIFRKIMNILVNPADWNQNLHQGRGGVKAGYGSEAKRINGLLLARIEKIDELLAEYQQKRNKNLLL